MSNFKEPQYGLLTCVARDMGITEFGLMVNQSWQQDPKGFPFTLARYKYVSKMFQGLERVLEIGCADAYGTGLVQQTVRHGTATDFDPIFVENFKQRMNSDWKINVFEHDILKQAQKTPMRVSFASMSLSI